MKRNLKGRLDEEVRWVYSGHDLDQHGGDDDEELARRAGVLEKVQGLEPQVAAITAVVRSPVASQTKYPVAYDPSTFGRELRDAHESGVVLSASILTRYFQRAVAVELLELSDDGKNNWESVVAMHQDIPGAESRVRFEPNVFFMLLDLITIEAPIEVPAEETPEYSDAQPAAWQLPSSQPRDEAVGTRLLQAVCGDASARFNETCCWT